MSKKCSYCTCREPDPILLNAEEVINMFNARWKKMCVRWPGMKRDHRYKSAQFNIFVKQLCKGKLIQDYVRDELINKI